MIPFTSELELIDFFNYVAQAHNTARYWIRNTLLSFYYKNPIEASVLIGFYFDLEIQDYVILLTQRTAFLKNHSNQISFPGGKKENTDINFIDTALRETEEEIGIPRYQIKTFGLIKPIISSSNFMVYPTLALIDKKPNYKTKNSFEVKEIFSVPCHFLLNPNQYQFKTVKFRLISLKTVFINYKNRHIWGLTAEILYFLALNLKKFKNTKKS